MRFIASDSLAAVSSKVSNSGNRNKIINGGMSVWQRGTSFSDPANMTGYTADRWVAVWGTAGRTFSQQAGFDNARYCLRVQRNSGSTGVGNSGIATFFETVNSIPLQGKTVTLSFSARCGANYSAASSQISAYVFTGTGTDQSASTWYSPGWTGSSQIIGQGVTLTTTSQRFTLTGVVASNATQIAVYFIGVPTGTAGAADYWEITNVQLEEGAVATPFEFEDYGTTLAKCQRYYEKTYDLGTAVATATQVGMVGNDVTSSANTSQYMIFRTRYQVRKRAAPTITTYDAAGNSGKGTRFNITAGGTDNTTVAADFIGENSFRSYVGISLSDFAGYTIHYTASAEL